MSALLKLLKVLKKAAEGRRDEAMLHILRGVNGDLIAAEAKYHKNCFSLYVLKDHKIKNKESDYEASFQEFATDITRGIREGKAYEMNSLVLGGVLVHGEHSSAVYQGGKNG